MRILFLSTWHPYPPDNGSKIRVYHLLEALRQRHEVSLVSFSFGSAQPEKRSGGGDSGGVHANNAVAVNPFEANRTSAVRRFVSPEPVSTRSIPAMAELVRRKLTEGDYPVVVASCEVMAGYVPEKRADGVVALELHNSLSRWMWERYEQSTSAGQRLRRWLSWHKTRRYERNLFSRFDVVSLVSEQDKAFSEQRVHRSQDRVEVVSNGVDCERNRPGMAQPVPGRLVYPGSLTYSVNFDAIAYFLTEIYPEIRGVVAEAKLAITGSTEGVDLDNLRLDESVCFTGYVEDVRIEVAQASVVIVPIREGGGTRLKILEAMALGVPVVSTSKGAEGLEVEAGVHLLIADEPEQFAAETARLLRDESLQRRLAANGRALVERRYDWRKIGRDYADLVERIAQEKRETSPW